MEAAGAMAAGEQPLDWSTAEALALASLAVEGYRIRLSGQDTARGTFSQRHAVLYDTEDGHTYVPLQHLAADQAPVEILNSPLSEAGVLGFEYGYSLGYPGRAGAVGGPVRRLRQRGPGDHRPVHRQRGGEVAALSAAWSCCCRTASKGRARSIPAPASSGSCSSRPKTTSRSSCPARRPSTSTACGGRRSAAGRSRWSCSRPRACCAIRATSRRWKSWRRADFERVIADDPAGEPASARTRAPLQRQDLLRAARGASTPESETRWPCSASSSSTRCPARQLAAAVRAVSRRHAGLWVQEEPENMGAWYYVRHCFGERLFGRFPLAGISRPASGSPAGGSAGSHRLEQQELLARAIGDH